MDELIHQSQIPAPPDDVWSWYTRPGAIERLMPPWEGVRVVERHGGLEDGSRVVLSVPIGPVRVRWVSRRRASVPGREFVDEQIEGPFRRWSHRHTIEPDGPSGSMVEDRIEYEARGGVVGAVVAQRIVRQRLMAMLRYAHDTLRSDLACHARYAGKPRVTVAVTGASGLLGSAITEFLTTGGHGVVRLVRRPPRGQDEAQWDVARGLLSFDRVSALDACIHLAGENIAGGRWTAARKARIRSSRVDGTRALAESLTRLPRPPKSLLCASAIGFYGSRPNPVTEQDGPGHGFLADLCQEWEAAASPAASSGIRVVHLRMAPVLSPAGGMLKLMLPVFKAGLGGPVGSGDQVTSWIGIDDVVGAFHHASQNEIWGPVNVTAPNPVTNTAFARTLARVLERPTVMRAPAFGVRLLMGHEMAEETALSGAPVLPERLEATGYQFRHAFLEPALRHLLGRYDA
jgi:uncharacterized protein